MTCAWCDDAGCRMCAPTTASALRHADAYAEYRAIQRDRARLIELARTLQSPENSAPLAELLALLLEAP